MRVKSSMNVLSLCPFSLCPFRSQGAIGIYLRPDVIDVRHRPGVGVEEG